MLSVNSCGSTRIKFDPDAYRANHYEEAIINEKEHVVYCFEEKFSEFACMHKTKWEELRRLLQDSAIPTKLKNELLNHVDSLFRGQE